MPSPAKMNLVHHHRRVIIQDASIDIDLGIDDVKSKIGEFMAKVGHLVSLVSGELQAVKDKTELIEEASVLNAKSMLSFYWSSNQQREIHKVVKIGVKMGQGTAEAIGATPRAHDNTTFEWARQEATHPCVELSQAQKDGFALFRQKGTRPRQRWFDRNVDPTYNARIQGRKNRPPQRSPPGAALAKAMGRTIPLMTPALVAACHAAMMAHRASAAQAFQAAGRALTPRELQTWLVGMLIQEWVSPGAPFGTFLEVDLAMDESESDSDDASESKMSESESKEEGADEEEGPDEEEEEAGEEEA